MSRDKRKLLFLFVFLVISCAIILLTIADFYLPVDPGRLPPEQSQEAIRATATSIQQFTQTDNTVGITPYTRPTEVPQNTPSPRSTRTMEATKIKGPVIPPPLINPYLP